MKRTPLLILMLAPIVLAGCQTIKAHNPFRHKTPSYETAQQERPLEVPPGIGQPPTSEALAIPNAGSGAGATAATPPGATAPSASEPMSTAPAAAAAAAGAGATSLTLPDTPDSVYHRVGLALDRAEVGTVTAHDDTARTYEVAVNTIVTEKAEGGFFHRMLHHADNQTVTGTVTVSVAPQGSGSVVEATGNLDAATRVIALLQQRLQ